MKSQTLINIDKLIKKLKIQLINLEELKYTVMREEYAGKTISFNYDEFKAFKNKYENAVEDKLYSFTYQKQEFLTDYAKYLLEYLKDKY